MTRVAEALAAARAALGEAGSDSPALDARLLMAHAAGLEMAQLIARGEAELSPLAEKTFGDHLRRRLAGEPVARILGEKEFWGLRFRVGAGALVPRPETEVLVQAALDGARASGRHDLAICDLGTGTGAILIALLCELPRARGAAVDISTAALEIARANAQRLGVLTRISFHLADFADSPEGPFDLVVSNPPYIASAEIAGLPPEVRCDPQVALDGGPDGLRDVRSILKRARFILKQGGRLLLEVGHDQAAVVTALCRQAGFEDVVSTRDLAGVERVISGAWPLRPPGGEPPKKALGNVCVTG